MVFNLFSLIEGLSMPFLPLNPRRIGPCSYTGYADGVVMVNEAGRIFPLKIDSFNETHKKNKFSWNHDGYAEGLAMALLQDVIGCDKIVLSFYKIFEHGFIFSLPVGQDWGPILADEIRFEFAELIACLN